MTRLARYFAFWTQRCSRNAFGSGLAASLARPTALWRPSPAPGLLRPGMFQKVAFGAAVEAGRDVQILRHLGQSADHPVLLSFPESAYLKGLLCRAI